MKKILLMILIGRSFAECATVNQKELENLKSAGKVAQATMEAEIVILGSSTVPSTCVPVVTPHNMTLCQTAFNLYKVAVETISKPCDVEMTHKKVNQFDPCQFVVSSLILDGKYCSSE